MKDEERRCPNCGHDVLDWDVTCPGCDQVPWDTPAGRRIIQGRRRRDFWITGGPILALLVLAAGVVVIGNIHLTRAVHSARAASDLDPIFERGAWLNVMLEDAEPGTSIYEELRAASRQWLADELPDVLAVIQDDEVSPAGRSAAAISVGKLFSGSSQFAQLATGYRREVIDVLRPLLTASPQSLRRAARLALGAMGARDARPREANAGK